MKRVNSSPHGAVVVALVMLLAAAFAWPAFAAPAALPDLDVVVVLEVHDRLEWRALHDEVLATPPETVKPLGVAVAAGKGGHRWISIYRPRFASVITGTGRGVVKVTVTGKVDGTEAARGLAVFEDAVLELQIQGIESWVALSYGLAGANAHLLELHLTRP